MSIRPRKLRLEASSVCQLRCRSCPNTSQAMVATVGRGFLRLEDFRRLLDENPRVAEIELSNYGEIFLNPELPGILECAHARKVVLTAGNGVNLNTASEEALAAVVRFGLREMTVSLDGASAEIYRQYRIKGDFDAVLGRIRRINELKRLHGTEFPRLTWQFIIFGHNEHELPAARRLAAELGMRFEPKLSWDDGYSPVRDRESVRALFGAASRDEYKGRHHEDYMQSICHQLWEQPQINWDGKVLGCCRNFWGEFGGNAFTDGLRACLNGDRIVYARGMLLGRRPARADVPCATCDIYRGMAKTDHWLQRGWRAGLSKRWHGVLGRLRG